MRKELKKMDGKRMRFRATVERFGTKSSYCGFPKKTILLKNVCFADSGNLATEHLWFTVGQWADWLEIGATFEFDARIDQYNKGYQGRRAEEYGLESHQIDYHLERPTKIVILHEKILDN
ncbi:Uncharacterised protein [uncultured archaeon]|nr:Uncharacterised protein [uncultured archaeon]